MPETIQNTLHVEPLYTERYHFVYQLGTGPKERNLQNRKW